MNKMIPTALLGGAAAEKAAEVDGNGTTARGRSVIENWKSVRLVQFSPFRSLPLAYRLGRAAFAG
jgi:hypothetical protein